ncbi:Hydroxyacyl-coenzyme A dehydrogenase [Fasciola hepatica]|uniref:Trifunctional enzyme subunit alpha, mitochondrial n=1 Tax=Fasciola hepatica TaxID=6192 RepID=A0A4E0R1E8_FASHE|nr:Hydroxyacyl-coenzyme A dehydrogenase [Fasciola hepatica]
MLGCLLRCSSRVPLCRHPTACTYRRAQLCRNFGKFVTVDKNDGVAVIRLDNVESKVNALTKAFSTEILDAMKHVEQDATVFSAVLISKKPECFIAGADINLLASCTSASEAQTLSANGQALMAYLEEYKKPLVAAIMGSCLGGGLELALACHYRLAVDTKQTVLGTPEVKLGLLPGAGGTQRLLETCPGINQSLQMVLKGSLMSVSKAKKMGLVHHTVSPLGPGIASPTDNTLRYLESVAVSCAQQLVEGTLKPKKAEKSVIQKVLWKAMEFEYFRHLFFNQVRKKVMEGTHGLYPAPLKIIELFETSVAKGSKVGYELESKMFGELAMTSECKALIGLFFGHTECKKRRLPVPKQPVQRLGVLGAGLMGSGIAQTSIAHGIPTILKDISATNLAKGEEYIQSTLNKMVQRKRMSTLDANRTFALLNSTMEISMLRSTDMVIEAVYEDLNLKHQVVKDLEAVLPANTIIASNTSALPIHRIAEASRRPDRFIGMHYFSPVEKMELLEIVVADKTAPDTVASAMNVGLRQGKAVILVKDGPGFYTTRLLGPMLSEAIQIMQEGVSPSEMDKATFAFGWPVGLASLADEVGIDVACHVAEFLSASFKTRMAGGNIQLLKEMVAGGMLGRKSGRGLFVYSGKPSKRLESSEALTLIERFRIEPRAENTRERIQYRLLSRFINEAVLCLQEGILINGPVEGDIGAVFGLGFPPCLGGPFRYVDLHGAANLVSRMEEFQTVYGDQFIPCPLLMEHAKNKDKRFHK